MKTHKRKKDSRTTKVAARGSVQRMVRWRRTSQSLPKVVTAKDGSVNSVLVYKKNGFECSSDIQVFNTVFLRKNRKWATHWMPLPEPPNASAELPPPSGSASTQGAVGG